VSAPEPEAAKEVTWLEPLLVIGAVVFFAVAMVWDSNYPGIALAGLTAGALTTGRYRALHVCALALIIATLEQLPGAPEWPVPGLVGLLVFAVLARVIGALRGWTDWLERGRLDGRAWMQVVGISALTTLALGVWLRLTEPDLAGLRARLPTSPLTLVAFSMAFALLTAAVEEGLFRGLFLRRLEQALGGRQTAVLLSSSAFGLMFLDTFVGGVVGVGFATILGLLLAGLRRRTGGMLAPFLAHALVKVGIVALVLTS
jgi:uncharacterized protein